MENFTDGNKEIVSVFQVGVMSLSDILHLIKNQTRKDKKKEREKKQDISENVGFSQI